MMKSVFREALNHGEGYKFTYKGKQYEVIDNIIIIASMKIGHG